MLITGGEEVNGYVAPGFESVRAAFAENFRDRGEVGAAFAAFHNGKPLVDLWGGTADRVSGRPWQANTLQLIFSGTKGLTAMCVLKLLDQGRLDLDAAVATYWPEFGKPNVRIREVVSHTSRLPGVDAPTSLAQITDDRRMAAELAAQQVSNDPRAEHCYHALTYGWLCGEVIRRIDGRSVGQFFAEEFAEPLDLDVWIGLPAEQERRVSRLELDPTWPSASFLSADVQMKDPLIRSIWGNPPLLARDSFPWNAREFHAAEVAAANAIATARAVAKLYDAVLLGGLLSREALSAGLEPLCDAFDVVHEMPLRYGVGFSLQTDLLELGPPEDAFGIGGAGGSMHGAWPSLGIGFSYAMNLMRDDHEVDPRSRALLAALHEAAIRANRS